MTAQGTRQPAHTSDAGSAIDLSGVSLGRQGNRLLDDIHLQIDRGQQWALIGANGAGKSTLLSICGAVTFPSSGTVQVLGHRMGAVDLRELRRRIGHVTQRHPLSSNLSVREMLLTGVTGTVDLVPRWAPSDDELDRADRLMKTVGLEASERTRWKTMSQGERGRALIARALMAEPQLLLLDEPSTGLDVAAREQLIDTLAGLETALPGLTTVVVTHHFEELPPSTSHAALLRNGRLIAAGSVGSVLTSDLITTCFNHPLEVLRRSGRWSVTTRVA